jgi:hypothetical protein
MAYVFPSGNVYFYTYIAEDFNVHLDPDFDIHSDSDFDVHSNSDVGQTLATEEPNAFMNRRDVMIEHRGGLRRVQ